MIDTRAIIARLKETGYKVFPAREKEVDLYELADFPVIYVGYNSIDREDRNQPLAMDFFSVNGENLVQGFTIQILAEQNNFIPVWKAVYKKLYQWNPIESEASHTSFTYFQGGMMGLADTRIYWVDIWKVGFPTNTLL